MFTLADDEGLIVGREATLAVGGFESRIATAADFLVVQVPRTTGEEAPLGLRPRPGGAFLRSAGRGSRRPAPGAERCRRP